MLHKERVDELMDEAERNIPGFFKGIDPKGFNCMNVFVGVDTYNNRIPLCVMRTQGDTEGVAHVISQIFKDKGVVAYVVVSEGHVKGQDTGDLKIGDHVVIAYATDGFYSVNKTWKVVPNEDRSVTLVQVSIDDGEMDGAMCHLLDEGMTKA
jgi:hypothetical protein